MKTKYTPVVPILLLPNALNLGLSLDELHKGAAEAKAHGSEDLDAWLATRPAAVVRVVRQLPPWQVYRVKEGAPYRVTGPGSIGPVLGASEDGKAIFEAHILCPRWEENEPEKHQRLLDLDGPMSTHLDPEWLEVVEPGDPK